MPQETRSSDIAHRIQHAFSRAENCCDYLYEMSDCMDFKFSILSHEFNAAQSGVIVVFEDGDWIDQSARNDVLRMLRKAESVMEIAGLPFLKREMTSLVKAIEL